MSGTAVQLRNRRRENKNSFITILTQLELIKNEW
jgi:hypothetical protein